MDTIPILPPFALATGEALGLAAVTVAVTVGVIWLAWKACKALFVGALGLLEVASTCGFVGLALYIMLWALALPVMLVLCLLVGALAMYVDNEGGK